MQQELKDKHHFESFRIVALGQIWCEACDLSCVIKSNFFGDGCLKNIIFDEF